MRKYFLLRAIGILTVLILSLSCAHTAKAACSGSSPTYTSASTSETDVQACNALTVDGDAINVPCSGTQSVTWTTSFAISHSIVLNFQGGTPNAGPSTFGSGTNCLTITDNVASGPLFTAQITSLTKVLTIQGVTIIPVSNTATLGHPIDVAGTCSGIACPLMRLDNIILGNGTLYYTAGGNGACGGACASWLIVTDNVWGVVDHVSTSTLNGSDFADPQDSAWLGVGANGDNSWASADTFGSGNGLYFENNLIYINNVAVSDCETNPIGGAIGGCRYKMRFNHINLIATFGGMGNHGWETDGRPRSGREIENYQNTWTCSTESCEGLTTFRGGAAITFGNSVTNLDTGFIDSFAALNTYRRVYGGTPGFCGGLNSAGPFDTNDNTVYLGPVTITVASGRVLTFTWPGSPGWTTNQWAPNGSPYSIYDSTQGFFSEITANTINTLTVIGPIFSSNWYNDGAGGIANGDSVEIVRATVCADQPGRGAGLLVQGTVPVLQSTGLAGPVNQALDPVLEWNDAESPVRLDSNVITFSHQVEANRDWYTDNWYSNQSAPTAQVSTTSPFNGSTTCAGTYSCGVGFGTLANRPTTCTTGVFYDATNAGTWNTSGLGTNDVVYQCGAGNTWTVYYTPYAYPYPLDGGSTAATPTFSPVAGAYPIVQSVTITSTTVGATICFTTDGSIPAASVPGTCSHGTTYVGPVSVPLSLTLQAIASITGFTNSSVGSAQYILPTGNATINFAGTLNGMGTLKVSGQ